MALFGRLARGLEKTRSSIAEKIGAVFSGSSVDDNLMDELEEALIMADVGAKTASDICMNLRETVKKKSIKDPQLVKDELRAVIAQMLSGESALKLQGKPAVVLVIGVNGVGKTTFIGKLANVYTKAQKSVIIAAADTFRAAAIDQLAVWAGRAGAELIKHSEGSDPSAVIFDAISAGKARGADLVLCDTAGRLHNKKNLMDELAKIRRIVSRETGDDAAEVLLVLDATTGQNALNQARQFKEVCDITGIVLTKLDGTAKGGVVIGIVNELKVPVKFVCVGEQIDDIQPFSAEDFAAALF